MLIKDIIYSHFVFCMKSMDTFQLAIANLQRKNCSYNKEGQAYELKWFAMPRVRFITSMCHRSFRLYQ